MDDMTSYWTGRKRPDISRMMVGNKRGVGNKSRFKKGHNPYNKGLDAERQPNYKDGRSFKRGKNWNVQKEKCYKRDKYKCRDCGRKKKDGWTIQCHHLVDWEKCKSNRLSILITVCVGCHAKRHKIGFKKKNDYWKNRKKYG